jgi:hypothetical protein
MRHTDEEKLAALSAAIDAVNRGDKPGGPDEETKELAGVALLLKQAGPPPAVVAGLVDTLGDELAAKNRKRRWLWLTSGAAGTAAAAMLVFALNTGPSALPQPPLTPPPTGSVVIESVPVPSAASPAAPDTAKADRKGPETAMTDKAAAPAGQQAPAPETRTPATGEKTPAAQPRPGATPGNGQAEQRVMLAKVPDKVPEKAATEKSVSKAAVVAPAAYLTWPGHEPDSVTVDKAAATVRQVYGSGEQAIVITQRVVTRSAAAPGDAKAARAEEPDPPAAYGSAPPQTNRVTLIVKGVLVTVEGSQPVEELQKIARSLE